MNAQIYETRTMFNVLKTVDEIILKVVQQFSNIIWKVPYNKMAPGNLKTNAQIRVGFKCGKNVYFSLEKCTFQIGFEKRLTNRMALGK